MKDFRCDVGRGEHVYRARSGQILGGLTNKVVAHPVSKCGRTRSLKPM